MEPSSFGYWLRLRRKALDLTREGLANRVGYSAETIRKIETEQRRPSAEMAERLAEILSIPQNERTAFLRFARGDWRSAPSLGDEGATWRISNKGLAQHPRSNLPATFTSLIGRNKEMAVVHEYLQNPDIRLVTLIGPPGVGKTRLSIETAHTELSNFPDGVFFVALAPLEDPSLIALTIVQTLGFVEAKNTSVHQQLMDGIGGKRMLIVLDNCEHLIENIAPLVADLLSACSRLKILATSREAMRVTGEWLCPVPALDVPKESLSIDVETASQFPALTLFAERARAVKPDFALNAENIQAVSSICAQLEGLPLAIELIAARMRLMSPAALLEHWNAQYILSADRVRAVSTRQKTLNNAIAWSYNLLSAEEQKLFAYLSVFSGGFTLESAEAIVTGRDFSKANVIDLLGQLINKSLVHVGAHSEDPEQATRYEMLETIQEYARRKLWEAGEEYPAQMQHLDFFLSFVEQAQYKLHTAEQKHWYRRLEAEHDNLRAALAWALQVRVIDKGMLIVGALHWFWWIRGYWSEGREWAVQFISQPEAQARTYARGQAVGAAGDFAYELGDLAEGEKYFHESVEIGRELGEPGKPLVGEGQISIAYEAWGNDPDLARQALEDGLHSMENTPPAVQWIVAWLHHCLGVTFKLQEDYVRAREYCEKSIRMAQDMGDRYLSAYPMMTIGSILGRQGKRTEAKSYLQEALAIEREMGDRKDTATSLLSLGEISCLEGKYNEARSMLEEALSISRELNWQMGIGNMIYAIAFIEQLMGNVTRAKSLYKEALPLCIKYGDHVDVTNVLEGLAQIAAINGDFKKAAHLFGASVLKHWYVMDAEHKRWIQLVRQSLGDETFDAHQRAGYNLKLEQAVELAFKESEE